MKCQNCGKNYANVRYEEVINGKRSKAYLCEECADKMNIGINFNDTFNFGFDFENMIDDFFGDFSSAPTMTLPKVFSLEMPTKKIYENTKPKKDNYYDFLKTCFANNKENKKEKISEKERLQNELNECIKKEEYERAAEIRDKIKSLDKKDGFRKGA